MELTFLTILETMPGLVGALALVGLVIHWRQDIKTFVTKEWMELLKESLEGRLQRIEDKLDKLNGED